MVLVMAHQVTKKRGEDSSVRSKLYRVLHYNGVTCSRISNSIFETIIVVV